MTKPRKPRTPRVAPSYFELLRDPRWQRRKSEIMDRDGWECVQCGHGDRNLQVHHSSYVYGRMPWEYEDVSLHTLCDGCHAEETQQTKEFKAALLRLPPGHMERLLGYVEAMSAGDEDRIKIKSGEQCQGVADYFWVTDCDVFAHCDEAYTVQADHLSSVGVDRHISLIRAVRAAAKASR